MVQWNRKDRKLLAKLHTLHQLTNMGRAEVLGYEASSARIRASVTSKEWGELAKAGASLCESDGTSDVAA